MRYRLCPKLLGLEKTQRACFQSQLGKCDGACEGTEPPASYNERFRAAFERQRVAAWPYPGPVLIKEQHPAVEGMTGYIVDQWCLVARLREYEDGTVESTPEAQRFDLDRYKIIKQFLENPRHSRQVVPVPDGQLTVWQAA
jgi:DNA polymerase-3 subunit epsilon